MDGMFNMVPGVPGVKPAPRKKLRKSEFAESGQLWRLRRIVAQTTTPRARHPVDFPRRIKAFRAL